MTLPIVDTKVVENFFTDEEVDMILQEYHNANRVSRENPFYRDGVLQNYTQGIIAIDNGRQVHVRQFARTAELLKARLAMHFGDDINIGTAHVLRSYQPYKCHTDGEDGQAKIDAQHYGAYTFVIPLETVDSYTIVFNEYFDKGKLLDEWFLENPDMPKKDVITDEIYEKHLSAEYREYMRYLSIDTIFPWKKGSCLGMSRYKFHGSDNFPTRMESKLGIIVWTVFNHGPKSI